MGYNGSGKTTLIECLKYATTGELPPNSKGGAFIHDPKLCGEKEVLAQVKLAFRSNVSEKFIVTRNLSLTVKKTTRSQKTLEGSLVHMRGTETNTISTRVAQLDELVPMQLGVSTAILDAVIFCHQDESLWPMSEPSALKKRFDEIFEAMRYTKAIDNLKVLRKKHGEELAKLKIIEEQARITKEKADRAEKRSIALQAEINDLSEKYKEATAEMDELQRAQKEKQQQANSFLGIVHELKNKKDKLEDRQEMAANLKARIDIRPESDEWLEQTLAEYEEKMARYQVEVNNNTAAYKELQAEVASTRKSLGLKMAEQGKHESDKEKYERQLQTRINTIHEAARLHSIRGYEGDLSDALVRSFNDKIMKLLADKRRELENVQRDNGAELDRSNGAITALESRKSARMQDRVFAKNRIGAVEKQVQSLQAEASILSVDESTKAILDSQYRGLEEQLQQAVKDLDAAGFDRQLREESERLSKLESENDALGRELVECTRLASDRAQLDLRKKELKEKSREVETLVNAWRDRLAAVLGDDWTPETAEPKYQVAVRQQGDVVGNARSRRDAAQKELEQLDFKVSAASDRRRKLADEGHASRDAIEKVFADLGQTATVDEYTDVLDRSEDTMLALEKDVSLFDALNEYYSQCMSTLQKKNKCQLCERDFTGQPQQKTKFQEKIRKHLTPKDREGLVADLDKAQIETGRLRELRPQYETYVRVNNLLPGIDTEIKTLEAQRLPIVQKLEGLDLAVTEAEEKLADIQALGKPLSSIAQASKSLREAEGQIDRLVSQQQTSGTMRSVEEVHELQAACAEQMRAVKAKISKLSTEKQRMRDTITTLELERSEMNNKRNGVVQRLERKAAILQQIQSLKDDGAAQRGVIEAADKDLEALEAEIVKAKTMRDAALERGRAKEQKIAEERDRLASSVSELKMIEMDINDYLERGGPGNIASGQRAIEALEKRVATLEKDMADLATRTNKLKQEIANSDLGKKNIAENLQYRQTLKTLETLRREIAELESRNASEDYERLMLEARAYETQYAKLSAERGSMMGSMKTKDEELGRLLAEWELDYKDAAHKYREAHIKVETTKAAIEDLGRYGSALDKAIMQYHSLKMEQVNRIAGELWQATYHGTDIDTILIRSDSETATGKRNYNYRVCMVKQDTEMDMRGRCSAGQKVLASIIIRLALAESFGVNCGLIALDEPTTNLDSENVRALARSLHAIIKARQAQANFQLIVITHDEEFLRAMKCSEFCEFFYRVKRDEHQNSVISRESITTVME